MVETRGPSHLRKSKPDSWRVPEQQAPPRLFSWTTSAVSALDWQRHLVAKNTLLTKCCPFQLKLNMTAIQDLTTPCKGTFPKFSGPICKAQQPMVFFYLVSLAGRWRGSFPDQCPLACPIPVTGKEAEGGVREGPGTGGGREGEVPVHL